MLAWIQFLGYAMGVFLASGAPAGPTLPGEPETTLQPGKSLVRRLSQEEVQRYRFWVEARRFVRIVADQRGIDVSLALISPEGTKLREVDGPTGNWGLEAVSWIAETGGLFTVEVRPSEDETNAADYELRIGELREPRVGDCERIDAEAEVERGSEALYSESAQVRGQSLPAFERALAIWLSIADVREQAIALFCIGRAQNSLSRARLAVSAYADSVALWREVEEPSGLAGALFGLAQAERLSGNPESARVHFAESIEIGRALADPSLEGESLASLGSLEDSLGERQEAVAKYEAALPLLKASRNRSGVCRTVNNVAFVRDYMGEKRRALDGYRLALDVCKPLGSKAVESQILSNIGRVYLDLGQTPTGIAYLTSALSVAVETGDRRSEATVLLHLGRGRLLSGDVAQAEQAYRRALDLWRVVGDKSREGTARNLVGELDVGRGRLQEALSEFDRALELAREAKDPYLEASVLSNRGAVGVSLGESESARRDLEAAILVRRAVGDRQGEASTLLSLARLELAAGSDDASWRRASAALDLVESLRTEVAGDELRATFFATVQRLYDFSVDLLMHRHAVEPGGSFDRLAFETSERSRARSLIDLLSARDTVRQGVDPALLSRERTLRKKIATLADPILQARAGTTLGVSTAVEIEALRRDYQGVQEAIRTSSPKYAALTMAEPLDLDRLQKMLDEETLLLEYRLGQARSYLWLIARGRRWTVELPGRDVIEASARRLYEAWCRPGGEAVAQIEAARLSEMILGPAAVWLETKRLAIVADGALHLVPFGALPDPNGGGASGNRRRALLVRHEVLNLPSASVLAVLRQDRGRAAPDRLLAILADPVFDWDDPRVVRSAKARTGSEPGRDGGRSARDFIGGAEGKPPRLVFTRREALAIRELAPASERIVALDFDANLAMTLSPELSRYQYVHLATHGVVDGDHPDRSGLLLSTVDREGKAQDGFLPVAEIFNLRLSAGLVVLSACGTALGREVRGEGLVGLTRAFMYAGAPRVVASLWRVDDAATAELMKKLYEGMLGPRKLRPAAALREAQLAVAKQKRWRDPYYWAAFVLQGEWN